MALDLDANLLRSVQPLAAGSGDFHATLEAHGLFNTFQFVLRLSPAVHRLLAESPSGIVTASEAGFERSQAFSTYLHETVHWWQHVGSTYGLMLSLSYPTQAHANYTRLKDLIELVGFKKSIRRLVEELPSPSTPDTAQGKANIIINNHFDFGAFRNLTFSLEAAKATIENPMFESVGHSHELTYGNNLLVLGATTDPEFQFIPHPREWEAEFDKLRTAKEEGFFYGSRVGLWPIGAREVLEGQACFCQMQFLAFASGGGLNWDDFRAIGMLHGVYEAAFQAFLERAGLEWPPQLDHPTVGLFLLICDMAINPGAGFPFPPIFFKSFITDTDPGTRFMMLATLVRLKCPEVVDVIREYSRAEYQQVTERLADALLIHPPLLIAETCAAWAETAEPFAGLMEEYRTFNYQPGNLPVRVMFSHFLAFMRDKLRRPEVFCWPGAWMAGDRVSTEIQTLFERHSALFVDKEDDDGVFPRLHPDRDAGLVQSMFDNFYAINVTYDMTDQWIRRPGPFAYDFRWLAPSQGHTRMKDFADRNFKQIYGVHPDSAAIL